MVCSVSELILLVDEEEGRGSGTWFWYGIGWYWNGWYWLVLVLGYMSE